MSEPNSIANQRDHLDTAPQQPEVSAQESTMQGRHFQPWTDIYETADALTVIMEVPGVDREALSIKLDKRQLDVDGPITLAGYGDLKPVYTEYDIGHFHRSFRLSSEIDGQGITAQVHDGVLKITLPKVREASVRVIEIQ